MVRLINTSLMFFAIIGILLLCGIDNVVGQCHGDMQRLITQCAAYVQKSKPKTDPSQECCNVIRNADVSCVCQHLTKEILQLLDMDKVIYVAQFCGTPIPSGAKCGGVTVP